MLSTLPETHFGGRDLLRADLEVTHEWGRPETAKKVKDVVATFFGAADLVVSILAMSIGEAACS